MSVCPKLYLAPMEGVGSRPFRVALATIGGFDEACTEFLRVPTNAHVPSLAKRYDPNDTAPIPQAAQIMGSIPHLMADMTEALIKRGAPRVDLNCGCPSNTVTGRGAGSSLLKTPTLLYDITRAMCEAAEVPISVKLRSGFEDTSLFEENLLAAQEAGASFITLHPRTKLEGYKPPAHWDLIARAKQLLNIPVVGNGDIKSIDDVIRIRKETNCDAIMIGRQAVIDPWIFHKIKAYYSIPSTPENWEDTENYIRYFYSLLDSPTEKSLINQLKQLVSFLFQASDQMNDIRLDVLQIKTLSSQEYLDQMIQIYRGCFLKQQEIRKLNMSNSPAQKNI